jgi:hypothetical protein
MLYNLLVEQIKKNFFVVSFEKLKNETTNTWIERYRVKHPLLKPELIVLNDQPMGFKESDPKFRTLENYSIYLELDYLGQEHKQKIVTNFELYAESTQNHKNNLSSLIELAELYSKTIEVEQIKKLTSLEMSTFLINSRLKDFFMEEDLEQDLEENLITEKKVEQIFKSYMLSFNRFIRLFDASFNPQAAKIKHPNQNLHVQGSIFNVC